MDKLKGNRPHSSWTVRKYLKMEWQLHVMMLVPVIALFIFHYLPMGGIVIALQNYKPAKGILGSKWVGFDNFSFLFKQKGFINSIRNTVFISVWKIVLHIAIPVTFSVLLNEIGCTFVKRSIQTIIYMPHFVSWVLMAGILVRIMSMNGILNQAIVALGGTPVILLADKNAFPYVIIFSDIYKEFGYGTIVYLAAITGISPTLYEAATMDGANHFQKILHVTLPGMTPTIILMSALALGRILNAGFDQIFNLYSPIVYATGDIIDTFVYRMAFNSSQFSISTAANLFKSVISCVLVVASYRIAYRTSGYRIF